MGSIPIHVTIMELYNYQAELIRVVDGDTVELRLDLGMNSFRVDRFRLARINAPEIHNVAKTSEEFKKGEAARLALEAHLKNPFYVKTVKDTQDKYGRYLVEIFSLPLSSNINDNLVSDGFAVYKKY